MKSSLVAFAALSVAPVAVVGDCGWVHTCGPRGCPDCKDDGSPGYRECCGGPGPSPGPSPGPPSPPSPGASYCPQPSADFKADYGSPQWSDSGWTIHGGARASSRASYNFAGGFLEFDMDLAGAQNNVNNNFYGTFPAGGDSGPYCDSGRSCGGSCCAEMDFTENNGNCFQATTWHKDRGGQDHDGKAQTSNIGNPHCHVKATWSADGSQLTVDVCGATHSGEGYADVLSSHGMVLYSSQWTGWVPGSCPGGGNLDAATFSVSNIRIKASIVQGPEPRKCSGMNETMVV